MKIGELARLNNVTIDTIRHYISIGLLIPHKNGSQYDFSLREAENLQYIQKLKSMRFHLKEIEDIMNLRRTSNWVEPETMKQYIHMLQEKSGELAAEQVAIKGAEELVAKEIREFEETGKPNRERQGVPIRARRILYVRTVRNSWKSAMRRSRINICMRENLPAAVGMRLPLKRGFW